MGYSTVFTQCVSVLSKLRIFWLQLVYLVDHSKRLLLFFSLNYILDTCVCLWNALTIIAVSVSIWWLTEFKSLFLFDNPVKHVLLAFKKVLRNADIFIAALISDLYITALIFCFLIFCRIPRNGVLLQEAYVVK